mmetsp:Transcript_7894/g.13242  ORF Transcript_7894/g.13242 Transcript_7894/m.13242 type:complete len:83 (+) Transcript_7894:1642-1890(+)
MRPSYRHMLNWLHDFEIAQSAELKPLDSKIIDDYVHTYLYNQVRKYTREEMFKLEAEFNQKYPVDSVPVPSYDLEAFERVRL